LAPFSNTAPKPELRFPLNFRVLMRAWDYLFSSPASSSRTRTRARPGNRGGYLVTGLSHCGACHTPKNVFGADRRGRAFCRRPGAGLVSRPASTARRAAA